VGFVNTTNPPQPSLIREGVYHQNIPSPDKGRWPKAGGVCLKIEGDDLSKKNPQFTRNHGFLGNYFGLIIIQHLFLDNRFVHNLNCRYFHLQLI
jgi:hypothetical protein